MVCFGADGCDAPFESEEVKRFLDPGTFVLFQRIRSRGDMGRVSYSRIKGQELRRASTYSQGIHRQVPTGSTY